MQILLVGTSGKENFKMGLGQSYISLKLESDLDHSLATKKNNLDFLIY